MMNKNDKTRAQAASRFNLAVKNVRKYERRYRMAERLIEKWKRQAERQSRIMLLDDAELDQRSAQRAAAGKKAARVREVRKRLTEAASRLGYRRR
jgi:hypothetical protein